MNLERLKESIKRIATPMRMSLATACVLAGILICAGGYRFICYTAQKKHVDAETIAAVTPRKTPYSPVSPNPPKVTPTARLVLQPEKSNEFPVLSSVSLKDGTTISYYYDKNKIVAVKDGITVVQVHFEDGNAVVYKKRPLSNMMSVSRFDSERRLRSMRCFRTDHYYDCEYDTAGRMVKRSAYDDLDRLLFSTFFRYDSAGVLAELETVYPENPKVLADEWGYLTEKLYHGIGSFTPVHRYDRNGDLVQENYQIGYSSVSERTVYDEGHVQLERFCRQESTQLFPDAAARIEGSYGKFYLYNYEYLCDDDGSMIPACFYMRGDDMVVSYTAYQPEHVLDEHCVPEYDAQGNLVQCSHPQTIGFPAETCKFDAKQRKIQGIYHFPWDDVVVRYRYDGHGRLQSISEADQNGNLQCEFFYNENGKVFRYKKYQGILISVLDFIFDADGKALMKGWSYESSAKDALLRSVEYLYDDHLKAAGARYCYLEEDGFRIQEHDENGRKKSVAFYREDGSLRILKEYLYNEQGILVRCNEHFADGQLQGWLEYRHDGTGACNGWDYYTDQGKIRSDTEYRYDDAGRMIEKIFYNEDRSLKDSCRYEYDKNGYLTGYSDSYATYSFTDTTNSAYQVYQRCPFDALLPIF